MSKCLWKTFRKISVFEQNFIRFWQETIGRIVKTAFQVSTGTFYETFFAKKSLPLLVWILLEKTAKFPQINFVRVVATAFYLSKNKKNTVRRKTSLFFRKNTIFKHLWVVSQLDFWPTKIREHSLELHHFSCPKKQLEEESLIWKAFLDVLWISEQKRIRLLY